MRCSRSSTLLGSTAGNLARMDLDWTSARPITAGLARTEVLRFWPRSSPAIAALTARSRPDLRRRLHGLTARRVDQRSHRDRARRSWRKYCASPRNGSNRQVSLLDMGMDSLMAVELATSIEARLDIQLSALALNGGPTIDGRRRTDRPAAAPDRGHGGGIRRQRGARRPGARRRRAARWTDLGVEHAAEFSAEIAAPAPRLSRSPPDSARERSAQSAAGAHGAAQGAAHPGSLAAAYAQERTRTQRAGAGAGQPAARPRPTPTRFPIAGAASICIPIINSCAY